MKKMRFVIWALALILMMSVGCAYAAVPGDTVTVNVNLNNTDAVIFDLGSVKSYDSTALSIVSQDPAAGRTFYAADGRTPIDSGKIGTVTVKILENAKPGTYTITFGTADALTATYGSAKLSVSATVTVEAQPTEKPVEPTPTVKPADPTEKPADPTEKPADPTVKPADPTAKPVVKPTEAPAVKPTEKPAEEKKYYTMNVSSIGPRFKDVSELTDNWFMFSAVDLSKDGVQTLDLIAGDVHKIGTVTLTVANGAVTVDYDVFVEPIDIYTEFFTFFSDLESIETLDTKKLTGYEFGEAITLGEDTNLVLYLRMYAVYTRDNKTVVRFDANSEEYTTLVNGMMELLK